MAVASGTQDATGLPVIAIAAQHLTMQHAWGELTSYLHTHKSHLAAWAPPTWSAARSACGSLKYGWGCCQVLLGENQALYGQMTVEGFFAKHTYSAAFRQNYFLPMCAAVWSMPNTQVKPSLLD